jgi:hypothetical protein
MEGCDLKTKNIMTPQELIKICMQDFEHAKKFGMKETNWLPFKQAWFKAFELGEKQSSITAVGCQREQFYCGVLKRNEGDRCYNQCGGCADKEARNKQ